MEKNNARYVAASLLLGCLLGCTVVALRTSDAESREAQAEPLIAATEPARQIAPLAIPAREHYGAPYVQTRLHPLSVAAAMMLFSIFGLSVFAPTTVARPSSNSL